MEDIEDLLVGAGGAPPGFRLPLSAAVGVNPKKKRSPIQDFLTSHQSPKIPGTQVFFIFIFLSFFCLQILFYVFPVFYTYIYVYVYM